MNREKIVEKLLPLLSEQQITHDTAMKTWWRNIRSTGGMSLTHLGDEMFRECQLEYFEFDIGHASQLSGIGTATVLDRKLPCPHYLYFSKKRQIVRIYDSKVSLSIALYGSIHKYLKAIR